MAFLRFLQFLVLYRLRHHSSPQVDHRWTPRVAHLLCRLCLPLHEHKKTTMMSTILTSTHHKL
jgi:hypothetical protein